MKYVAVDGGLGNQMFQYAFLLALKAKGYKMCLFLATDQWEHHTGFELCRVFDINRKISYWEKLCRKFPFPFRKIFMLSHKTFKDFNFLYQREALSSNNYDYYYGTWQSELYFKGIRDIILKEFSFNLT